MNKFLVIIALSAVVSFTAGWSSAMAQNHNIKKIEQGDALLQVKVAGAALISIHAGHIAKKLFLEEWQFIDSVVTYTRLSGRTFFRREAFGEKVTQSRHCGENAEQNCEVLQMKKHSENLIVIVYRPRLSGLICAGMDYIDETRSSSRHRGLYGNYILSVKTCKPGNIDSEEVIARAAQYLSAVEENGNKKAKLGHYELPKFDAGGDIQNQTLSNSANNSENDTNQILAYWRSNPDVLRKSIAKATDEIRTGHLGIQDFKVVSATQSQSDKQQMKILTFFKLDYASVGQHSRGGSVEAGFDYYSTVVVDRRDNSVVEVGPATTEKPQ